MKYHKEHQALLDWINNLPQTTTGGDNIVIDCFDIRRLYGILGNKLKWIKSSTQERYEEIDLEDAKWDAMTDEEQMERLRQNTEKSKQKQLEKLNTERKTINMKIKKVEAS